jgi:putative acetyltransferase
VTVELRVATPADLPALEAAFESVAAEGRWIGTELPIDWDQRRPRLLASLSDPRWFVLLAVDGPAVVGWISTQLGAGGRAELGMGIVDGHRSAGLGTKLLAAAVGWAEHAGAHKVELEVWPTNERAIGLYRKFGFEVEGTHRRHWRRNDGSLWDSLFMALLLDRDSPGGPS